jgi:hypothetical protein
MLRNIDLSLVEISSEIYPSAAIGCLALGFSPSSMRISYTALEALLWPLRMAKVEHPKETICGM